ncbi:MAG: cytochrome b/b6 domain-containing protein [Chloroflexi bacterium]|nr:cytochrome b/b6 domain-containing protein [Chloroflexota bacterium]
MEANTATNDKEIAKASSEQEYFVRFNVSQRVEHLVLMITFTVLAVTGLAEKYYTAGWAGWLISILGGMEVTRLVHRAFGLVFVLSVVYHFAYLVRNLGFKHARPTMLPNGKDFRDVMDWLRYSFGLRRRPPLFGRYDYRQKFEYWGILFGGTIMILTGFVLAYPVVVTAILPGQFVAASREAHGNEAMLAVLTIVIWHLYDVILKPSIYPADLTIFSGKISRKRLEEEHPLEYAELAVEKVSEPAEPVPVVSEPLPPAPSAEKG